MAVKTRRIYVAREVGATCLVCQFRTEDRCNLFSEDLFARVLKDGQTSGLKEYKTLDACLSSPQDISVVRPR